MPGETIGIISLRDGDWPAGVPRHDYWMFDDRDVWRMHYDDRFWFVGAELLDDPAVVADHMEWRDTAIAQSTPLAEYLVSRTP